VTDIPASTSTTATLGVGGTVQGSLEVAGDHDWYAINLIAGQQVTISLFGSGANPVSDPYLNFRNAAGTILFHDDDSNGTLNSKIVFTATTSGTYYIDAGAWDATSLDDGSNQPNPGPNAITGDYTLTVQPYTLPPVWSYDQIADQLINGFWNAQGEAARHFAVSQGGTISVNYSTLTAAEQALAIAALGEWSDIIGVKFTPVTTGGQIVFSDAEDPTANGPVAQTDDSVGPNGIITVSHVDISSSWVSSYGSGLNSYSFQTYLHEIGHALGLGHAGDYNVTADYTQDALYANDAWSTTVMSYFDQHDNVYFANQGFTKQFVLTPMDADVVAMQQMYGLSTTTRTGDTTYGFNSNAGSSIYNAAAMGALAYTIFDSAGNDTLDYSGFTSNQLINLTPETFMNVGTGIGNVMIARGTVIENAIGGSGDDQIIGNDVANHLIGNGGNDTLVGGAGDDFLTGGSGVDTLTGGAGNDTFIDTIAGLNGDTITDFSAGDKIVITDASLSTFTFNVIGNLLTYNGFELHLGSAPNGPITASAAAGGGVQLTFSPDVQEAVGHAGDFNGDGHDDLLLRNDDGRLTVWLGTADGTLTDTGIYRTVDPQWQIAGIGDFNGDARDDILWHNADGRVTEWMGTSTGVFSDTNTYRTVVAQWQIAGTGDFNGDGRSDVLWRNADGRVTLWLGTANGLSDTNAYRAVDTHWQVAGTGDFNGDGIDDILWRNTDGRVTEWLGTTAATFSDTNVYKALDNQWQIAGVGDFNGDHHADLLLRNFDGRVTEWIGNGAGGFTDTNLYRSVDMQWQVAAIGHFNGDAQDDVLWQNADGRVTEWLGSNTGWFSESNSYRSVDSHWHVQPHTDHFM
jgi:Ca2+-binding RTX toxin-like protein